MCLFLSRWILEQYGVCVLVRNEVLNLGCRDFWSLFVQGFWVSSVSVLRACFIIRHHNVSWECCIMLLVMRGSRDV